MLTSIFDVLEVATVPELSPAKPLANPAAAAATAVPTAPMIVVGSEIIDGSTAFMSMESTTERDVVKVLGEAGGTKAVADPYSALNKVKWTIFMVICITRVVVL